MDWPKRAREGFALAATLAQDRGAERAMAGLSRQAVTSLGSLATKLSTSGRQERRQEVRALAMGHAPTVPDDLEAAPRALALLAIGVAPELGRRWLTRAPAPRPGFRPQSGLTALLKRIALAWEA